MKKRILTITLVTVLALSMLAIGCPPPPVEPVPVPPVPVPEVFTWRMQSLHPAGTPAFAVLKDFFVPRVKELTGGRLIIEPFPSGAVVADKDSFDAVAVGLFEAAQMSSAYWVGKEPAMAFLRAALSPFTELWHFDAWMWHGGGIELAREIYAKFGLHYVGPVLRTGEALHFREKVPTLADFKGTKVRTAVGPTAIFFGKLGGAPVFLPAGEIYGALDKGIVDAAEWMGLGENWGLGMSEVTDYFTWPSYHSLLGVDDMFVNMEAWEKLPEYLQVAVEIAVREWSITLWHKSFLTDIAAKVKFIDAGDTFITWPEEDMVIVRKTVVAVLEEIAAKSPRAAKAFESQLRFARALGLHP